MSLFAAAVAGGPQITASMRTYITALMIAKEALLVAEDIGGPICADEYTPIDPLNWSRASHKGRTVYVEILPDTSVAITMGLEREIIPAGNLHIRLDDFSTRFIKPAVQAISWRGPLEIGYMV